MNKGKIINVVTQSQDHRRNPKYLRRAAPQSKPERFQVKQAAVRHMLKEAMTNKAFLEHPFDSQYLDRIGFTKNQIKFLKKSLLTSDLKHFMKHNNKRFKIDSWAMQ